MSIATLSQSSAKLDDAEVLTQARAMNLAPGGGVGQAQLMGALYRPGISLAELTALIAGEPALALRTLKVANSAYYRRCGEVGTVDRAVQVLGATTVKGIAAAACLDRVMTAHPGMAAAEAARLPRHCIAAALAAQALARRCAPALEPEAFMAGVLHEVGMLVFWALRPDVMARQLAQGEVHPDLGISHAHCGQLVMQAWQLPVWLQLSVAHHHAGALPEGMAGEMCAITRLADALASRTGHGLGDDDEHADMDLALARCGLVEADLEALAAELPEAVEGFLGALNS